MVDWLCPFNSLMFIKIWERMPDLKVVCGYLYEKNELQPLSYNIYKNQRCIIVLKVKVKSRKL